MEFGLVWSYIVLFGVVFQCVVWYDIVLFDVARFVGLVFCDVVLF